MQAIGNGKEKMYYVSLFTEIISIFATQVKRKTMTN